MTKSGHSTQYPKMVIWAHGLFMARPSCDYQNDKENTKKKGEGLRVS